MYVYYTMYMYVHVRAHLHVHVLHSSSDNTPSMYLEKGEGDPGKPAIGNQVEAAITSSFLVLIGIFFPSVTGQ